MEHDTTRRQSPDKTDDDDEDDDVIWSGLVWYFGKLVSWTVGRFAPSSRMCSYLLCLG